MVASRPQAGEYVEILIDRISKSGKDPLAIVPGGGVIHVSGAEVGETYIVKMTGSQRGVITDAPADAEVKSLVEWQRSIEAVKESEKGTSPDTDTRNLRSQQEAPEDTKAVSTFTKERFEKRRDDEDDEDEDDDSILDNKNDLINGSL